MTTQISIVTAVKDLDANTWKEVLLTESLEDFQYANDVVLEGEALAFFEAIITSGVITLTEHGDATSFIDLTDNYTNESALNLFPKDGIVDEDLHNQIVEWFEDIWGVLLEDDARMEMDCLLSEWYDEVADNYEADEEDEDF